MIDFDVIEQVLSSNFNNNAMKGAFKEIVKLSKEK